MEHLKNKIKENKSFFESDSLPKGHKERFFKKIESQATKREKLNNILHKGIYSLAAAILLIFFIASPIFKSNNSKNVELDVGSNYVTILNEKSANIISMSETLDPINKEMVLNTLDQLIYEAIPFEDQLPQSMGLEQRNMLNKSYYHPKIEGLERLKGYVAQLLEL